MRIHERPLIEPSVYLMFFCFIFSQSKSLKLQIRMRPISPNASVLPLRKQNQRRYFHVSNEFQLYKIFKKLQKNNNFLIWNLKTTAKYTTGQMYEQESWMAYHYIYILQCLSFSCERKYAQKAWSSFKFGEILYNLIQKYCVPASLWLAAWKRTILQYVILYLNLSFRWFCW